MALNKINYVDNKTIITAQNLNNIQDEIIENAELIKKVAPRNLLDNSDFEIAQAGYGGTHGSVIYAADRWHQNDNTNRTYSCVTHNDHGALKCTSGTRIQQSLYLVDGETYTAAVILGDTLILRVFTANGGSYGSGELWVNYQTSNGSYHFIITDIPANTIVSEPVLYLGKYTIDTLPKYQPKGYSAELAECQRYYLHTDSTSRWSVAHVTHSGYLTITIPTPVTMRTLPSPVPNAGNTEIYTNGWQPLDVTSMYLYYFPGYAVLSKGTEHFPDITLTDGMTYLVNRLPSLSADIL